MNNDDMITIEEIDSLRYTHEVDSRWELRRTFLRVHCKNFPRSRLVCLSETYCNMVVSGCKYPPAVMELIAQLSEHLDQSDSESQSNVSVSSRAKQHITYTSASSHTSDIKKSRTHTTKRRSTETGDDHTETKRRTVEVTERMVIEVNTRTEEKLTIKFNEQHGSKKTHTDMGTEGTKNDRGKEKKTKVNKQVVEQDVPKEPKVTYGPLVTNFKKSVVNYGPLIVGVKDNKK